MRPTSSISTTLYSNHGLFNLKIETENLTKASQKYAIYKILRKRSYIALAGI